MGDVEMLIHDHVSQSIVPKSSTRLGQLQACNEEGMPSGPLACRPKKMVLSIGRMLELELLLRVAQHWMPLGLCWTSFCRPFISSARS